MKVIPRHLFVPKETMSLAYEDQPLSIGYGQTISQPYIVAFMLEWLNPQRTSKILEIGTGSGYQTAILSVLVKEVMTVEIRKKLTIVAKQCLDDIGCENVCWKVGDGRLGWPEKAPFDGIVISAATLEIPEVLVVQLKVGGRMIVPLGDADKSQELVCITREEDDYTQKNLLGVRFVPLI